jgi:hypothetical protein
MDPLGFLQRYFLWKSSFPAKELLLMFDASWNGARAPGLLIRKGLLLFIPSVGRSLTGHNPCHDASGRVNKEI